MLHTYINDKSLIFQVFDNLINKSVPTLNYYNVVNNFYLSEMRKKKLLFCQLIVLYIIKFM